MQGILFLRWPGCFSTLAHLCCPLLQNGVIPNWKKMTNTSRNNRTQRWRIPSRNNRMCKCESLAPHGLLFEEMNVFLFIFTIFLLWRVIIRAAGQMGKVIIAAVAPKSAYFHGGWIKSVRHHNLNVHDASISGKEQCLEQESGGMFERVQSRTWRLTAAMSSAESKFSGFITCRVCMIFQYVSRRRLSTIYTWTDKYI